MRLTRGYYPEVAERARGTKHSAFGLFGLIDRNCWSQGFLTETLWFNGLGEPIGEGAVSREHAERIARELAWDEVFLILPPSPELGRDENPGLEKLLGEHSLWLIVKDRIYHVDRWAKEDDSGPTHWGEVILWHITTATARRLIEKANARIDEP